MHEDGDCEDLGEDEVLEAIRNWEEYNDSVQSTENMCKLKVESGTTRLQVFCQVPGSGFRVPGSGFASGSTPATFSCLLACFLEFICVPACFGSTPGTPAARCAGGRARLVMWHTIHMTTRLQCGS